MRNAAGLGVAGLMALLACGPGAGCNAPDARLNAPPHGEPYRRSDLQGTFTYMADNALLDDMTVSDRHFLPHRAILSDLGRKHLGRLASLLEAYGGTLVFSTDEPDAELVDHRVQTIVDFLCEAGIEAAPQRVERGMSAATGMDADEAILIKVHEGTYDPEKSKKKAAKQGQKTPVAK